MRKAWKERRPCINFLRQGAAAPDRGGIAVDAEALAARPRQQLFGIAAAAEGSIDIDGVVARLENRHDLFEHHRQMGALHEAPPIRVARARAMRASRTGSNPSRSQIWNFWIIPTKVTRSLMPAWAMNSSGKRTRPSSSKFRNWLSPTTAWACAS